MRARLNMMVTKQKYSFICDAKVAGKIDRVVAFAGGMITSREMIGEDTVICVMKGE